MTSILDNAGPRGDEAMTHLHDNRIRSPIHIRCTEPEYSKSRADEAVLAAVVVGKPIAMVTAVILDGQALKAKKQVWAA